MLYLTYCDSNSASVILMNIMNLCQRDPRVCVKQTDAGEVTNDNYSATYKSSKLSHFVEL